MRRKIMDNYIPAEKDTVVLPAGMDCRKPGNRVAPWDRAALRKNRSEGLDALYGSIDLRRSQVLNNILGQHQQFSGAHPQQQFGLESILGWRPQ